MTTDAEKELEAIVERYTERHQQIADDFVELIRNIQDKARIIQNQFTDEEASLKAHNINYARIHQFVKDTHEKTDVNGSIVIHLLPPEYQLIFTSHWCWLEST